MDRFEALNNIFANVEEDKKILVAPLIEKVVYLENRLSRLEKYPFILYNKRTGESKSTGAYKQYKEVEQSYTNCLKILLSVLRNASVEKEDAFDQWIRERQNK